MADTRTLEILLTAKDQASKELGNIKSKLNTLQPTFKKMAAIGTAALTGIVAGMSKAISESSDLGESVNAVEVMFGDAAEGILELSKNSAKTVGLASKDFNGLSVQFGSFAEKISGEGGNVVGTIEELTGRAADFASVFNIDVAQAANTFQSGLAGQTEPLRQYGIDLSAASVQAFAVAQGIIETDREMSETEKVQARYALLMEQTSKTQGDFVNTSDSLANSMRIAKAEFTNTLAVLGESFIPIVEDLMTKVTPLITKIAEWIKENPELTKQIIIVTAAVVALVAIAGILGIVLGALNAPIIIATLAIVALIAIGVKLWKNWDKIKEKAKSLADAVGGFFTGMWTGVKEGIKSGINWVITKLNWFIQKFNSIRDSLSKIPGVSMPAIGEIPMLAKGGIVNKPTLAMIGEAGPEAVVPLNKANGMGGVTINITGGSFVGGTAEEIAEALGDKIMDSLRLNQKLAF